MSDQCRNCTIRGDIKNCLETDCFQHEDWWAQTVLAQLSEAQGEISKLHTSIEEYEIENDKWRNYYNNLKQENAALHTQLADAQKEAFPAYKREKALRCKAEAENADLRNRLKPVEEVYKKHEVWAREWLSTAPVSSRSRMLEFWQAICKAMEGK